MSDEFNYYRREKGRISQDYSRCDGTEYRPASLLKIIPGGCSSGGAGCIRDINGAAIGGGDVWRLHDADGKTYHLLITPAVWEEMKRYGGPFSRSIPGQMTAVVDLHDCPRSGRDFINHALFEVDPKCEGQWDDETEEWIEPEPWFNEGEYSWINSYTFAIPIKKYQQISVINTAITDVERNFLRDPEKNRVWRMPFVKVQIVYDFPEPWQLEKIISPWFWGSQKAYRELEYGWYFGRYGVFDNYEHPTTWRRFEPFPKKKEASE